MTKRARQAAGCGMPLKEVPLHINPKAFGKIGVVEELKGKIEDLETRLGDFDQQIECWSCGVTVHLAPNDIMWPIGRHRFDMAAVPSYHCSQCDEMYFPDPVFDVISQAVREAFRKIAPDPLPRNPEVLAFNAVPR